MIHISGPSGVKNDLKTLIYSNKRRFFDHFSPVGTKAVFRGGLTYNHSFIFQCTQ